MATIIIGYGSATLGGDVTMTNANQWYDGPSLELGAGTWLVSGSVIAGGNGVGTITARISDGTNHHASTQFTNTDAGQHVAPLAFPPREVVLTDTTTIKIQAAAIWAGAVMRAATTSNGSGNNAGWITAERKA